MPSSDFFLRYEIVSPANSPFQINSTTGEITVSGEVNYEVYESFELLISATDQIYVTTETINLTVIDLNDNRPEFVDEYSLIEIFNTLDPNQPIGVTIEATDDDGEDNNVIEYSIYCDYGEDGSDFGFFIDSNSDLRVNTTMGETDQDFECIILATNEGVDEFLFNYVNSTLRVLDVNDQVPEWEEFPFNVPTDESIPIQINQNATTTVGQPTLMDRNGTEVVLRVYEETPDANPEYSTIVYGMAPGNPQEVLDFFSIQRETGYVQIIGGQQFGSFEFDNDDNKVSIMVNASDNPYTLTNGQPSNPVEIKTLLLQKYTNYDPQFNAESQIGYPVTFIENAVFGQNDPRAVELPLALDPNNEDSFIDEICYFVYDDVLSEYFDVVKSPGNNLTTRMFVIKDGGLDREEVGEYNVTVLAANLCAFEGEMPPLDTFDDRAKLNVTVTVGDVDDTPPVFVEDLFAGMELTESDWSRDFEVQDNDESQERTYKVVEGSLNVSHPSLEGLDNPFTAEPNEINNLKILANFQPTNDMTGFFTFQVRAVDAGNNEAFSDAQVVIIATENQIFLTFNNPIGYVTQYDAEIKGVFDSVFPFNYTRDDISSSISESGIAAKIDQTIIRCHFLDDDSVPVLNSVVNG